MKQQDALVSLAIKVTPKARRRGVTGYRDGVLLVGVGAPAERGRATEEAFHAVAGWLGIPASNVRLAAGEISRNKRVEIHGISGSDLRKRLDQL
ncbi:MAG: DUF167 domain-containing protein, partial [Actinobacteria bacterium]|nr:DUF167 domain-containing protein [Actinomycetota bacterium]